MTALQRGPELFEGLRHQAIAEPGRAAFLVQVSNGVYAYVQHDGTWWVNTAGFVVGSKSVLVVDSCATQDRTAAFIAAIEKTAGDRPVTTLINTHEHGDHTYGNALFTDASVIAHAACHRAMLNLIRPEQLPPIWDPMPQWGSMPLKLPDTTYEKSLVLTVDGMDVELHHPGHVAHTAGDTVVWIPERRVLFAGDLVFHRTTPLAAFGSITGMLKALDWLETFGAEVIVPGHGAPMASTDLEVQRRYYRFVLENAELGIRTGRSPLEVARALDLGEFAAWPDRERIVMNLHRAFQDLGVGDEVSPDRVGADAVAYNGGRPMRCCA